MAVSGVTEHEWHLEQTIFIYNLGPIACTKVQNEDRVLKGAFGQFGTVTHIEVLESAGGKHRRHVGAALVEFQNDSEAKNVKLISHYLRSEWHAILLHSEEWHNLDAETVFVFFAVSLPEPD